MEQMAKSMGMGSMGGSSSQTAATSLISFLGDAGIEYDETGIVPASISPGYRAVYDLRFSSSFTLPPEERQAFTEYLELGRKLYFTGEHTGFSARNLAIASFLNELGAGGVAVSTGANGSNSQTCQHPILCSTPNAVAMIIYAATGMITSVGNGSMVTTTSTAVWGVGELVNVPLATVVWTLDINYWDSNYWLGGDNPLFFANLVLFL
jgi:hypothetical protein